MPSYPMRGLELMHRPFALDTRQRLHSMASQVLVLLRLDAPAAKSCVIQVFAVKQRMEQTDVDFFLDVSPSCSPLYQGPCLSLLKSSADMHLWQEIPGAWAKVANRLCVSFVQVHGDEEVRSLRPFKMTREAQKCFDNFQRPECMRRRFHSTSLLALRAFQRLMTTSASSRRLSQRFAAATEWF